MSEASVKVSISGADEALHKAECLVRALKEARTLACELASELEKLEINI